MSDTTVLDPNGNFPRRDFLKSLEAPAREKWEAEKVFEANYDESNPDTHFVTFPYPYMNGRLHLGHAFSLSKCEYSASYARLKGKNVLFPFGLHCTGMPIKTAADKVRLEIEKYGNPPVFPVEDPTEEEKKVVAAPATGDKKRKGPSKLATKGSGKKHQWDIMKSLGIPEEDIPKFADPIHWLGYFPQHAIDDMKALGLGVDWRRSFITTPANPYYDSFVRWQMNTLKAKGKVAFGKRNTVFSVRDGQPCMDHDRSEGEGVGITEYTIIKLQVLELPAALGSLTGREVSFICATLRPETMYGQTNCYVHPDLEYGAYEISPTEVYVCTPHCARNMACQLESVAESAANFGDINKLATVTGKDLLGVPVKAPLSYYDKIYTLPMLTIIDTMGTGIVTSVPSDSPDDFVNFNSLKNKPEWRAKWGITDEMVMPYEPIPIIDIPELGNICAQRAVEEIFKVQGPNDKENLAAAKKLCYDKGFHDGVMVTGEFKGQLVRDAKSLVGKSLIEKGFAFKYAEPAEKIISRSGDVCIVALVDQWYVDYGQQDWTDRVLKLLEDSNLYDGEGGEGDVRRAFQAQIQKLHEWACSRSFGLGSRIPWDEQFLVESLSDSTIYMAYYTVASFLQGANNLDGSNGSPLGIKPEQMTMEVWNYIFLDAELPTTDISEENLNLMRREFQYWYPVNLRVSGKDLINNHLSFFLFTHEAIWGDKYFPKGIRVNGHLKLNNQKMAKSTGNFLTVEDAIASYGADITRLALADAGDTIEDANCDYTVMSKLILRMHTLHEFYKTTVTELPKMRTGEFSFVDRIFDNSIKHLTNLTDTAFDKMLYHEAVKNAIFEYYNCFSLYSQLSNEVPLHADLVKKFLTNQASLLSVFCPHLAESLWSILGKEGSVLTGGFPAIEEVDLNLLAASEHIVNVANELRQRMAQLSDNKKRPKGKVGPPVKCQVFVSSEYKKENKAVLDLLERLYHEDRATYDDKKAIMKLMSADPDLKKSMKKLMPFIAFTQNEVKKMGPAVLSTTLKFDEFELLSSVQSYFQRSLPIPTLEIVRFDAATATDKQAKDNCDPLKPVGVFSWEN